MFNMIKLDWLCMKSFWNRGYFTLLFGISAAIFFSPALALLFLPYFMYDFGTHAFMASDKNEVDRLYLTLPVNRKIIVRAKFGLMFITSSVGLIASIIIALIFTLLYGQTIIFELTWNPGINTIFLYIAAGIFICGFMSFALTPRMFKLGWSKSTFFTTAIIIIGLAALTPLFIWLNNRFEAFNTFTTSVVEWLFSNIVWTTVILFCVAVILFAVSYALSLRNYAKREF